MFRRCLSLLVIAGFLASQLAMVPHSHGISAAAEQQNHDSVPHIHCGWFGSSDHSHNHDHGDHSHSDTGLDATEVNQATVDDEQVFCLTLGQSNSEHDSDAVYVSGFSAATPGNKVQLNSAWQLVLQSPLLACLHELQASARPPIHWHIPDKVQDASDSYLILRNLRI